MKIGIEIEFFLLKRVNNELIPSESNPESSLTSLVTLIEDFEQIHEKMR